LVGSGCTTGYGPRTIPPERGDYNRVIVRSNQEQMLLNMVRLRYDDTPLFLELNSVVAQYTLEGGASAGVTFGIDGTSNNESGLGGSIRLSEKPTISYAPLQGEEFAKRMLSPIAPETVLLLSQSGWSIERLLRICVKRMNGIPNAITASGPTPSSPPTYEAFAEIAAQLRKLQNADVLVANQQSLIVRPTAAPPPELAEVRRKLGLSSDASVLRLTGSPFQSATDELAIQGRSLAGVLFLLSQSVEPPPEHVESGVLVITLDQAGEPFDWSRVTGDLIRIHSKSGRPDDSFVRVHYRDHWFYVKDTDNNSKRTLLLLNYLFSLQAAGSGGQSPLLTLPAGG
jgi:hypothetical protein